MLLPLIVVGIIIFEICGDALDEWRDSIVSETRAQAQAEARAREEEGDKKRMLDACIVAGGEPVAGIAIKIVCVKRDSLFWPPPLE